MALNFKDKVVLVTGAGNGLGKSHALYFAARGAKVRCNACVGSACALSSALSSLIALYMAPYIVWLGLYGMIWFY